MKGFVSSLTLKKRKQLHVRTFFPGCTLILDCFHESVYKDVQNPESTMWVIIDRSHLGNFLPLANSYSSNTSGNTIQDHRWNICQQWPRWEFSMWRHLSEFMVIVPDTCRIVQPARENIFTSCLSSIELKNRIGNHSYPCCSDWQVKDTVWQLTIKKLHFFFFLRALGAWYFPTFPLIGNG